MTACVTCGDELHPERAERYGYCTKPDCVERNAKGLRIVAVGVNKAADQYVILDERTEREMAAGRYRKQPETPATPRRRSWSRRAGARSPAPVLVPRSSADGSLPRWSDAQQKLTLIYREMGLTPEEIARKIGVSPYLVTQILLHAG
jgi:hypothetical protein